LVLEELLPHIGECLIFIEPKILVFIIIYGHQRR